MLWQTSNYTDGDGSRRSSRNVCFTRNPWGPKEGPQGTSRVIGVVISIVTKDALCGLCSCLHLRRLTKPQCELACLRNLPRTRRELDIIYYFLDVLFSNQVIWTLNRHGPSCTVLTFTHHNT